MHSVITRHSAIAALFLLLAPMLAFAQGSSNSSLQLGPGDVVRVSVFGQPDLETLARIGDNGEITFPLIGSVQLSGRTTAQAEGHIADLLETRGFVRNAQVTIFLEERSQTSADNVTILGKVERPGKYPLQSISVSGVRSVVDLLATAGGTTEDAADRVLLLRNTDGGQERAEIDLVRLIQHGDLSLDVELRDGDIVLVPETDVFYIYGQVEQPGRYSLERDMTVMQALSVASGVTQIGNENGIMLRRSTDNGPVEREVRLTDELLPNDVIYVRERRF